MERKDIEELVRNYQYSRKVQKSLKEYDIDLIGLDILIPLYLVGDWVPFKELKERAGINYMCIFSERGMGLLRIKNYAEVRRNKDNTKDAKITSKGTDLIEKIFRG